MLLSDMEDAVRQAEADLTRADLVAGEMARLLRGRLRQVKGYNVLKNLKAELKGFNSQTGCWKEL